MCLSGGSRSPYMECGGSRGGPAHQPPRAPPPARLGGVAGTPPAPLSTPGPARGHRWARVRECEGSPRLAPQGPNRRARGSGPFGRGLVSSVASPCPRYSGNPAWAAGRRARPSRSTWPSWDAAGRASPVSWVAGQKRCWDRTDGERVWTLWTCLQADSPTSFGAFCTQVG